eukprot:gb/GECG01013431.1/.p1 GENE.gb/GECG01013431.1/~~gb/GECG01013431.1/.p1  ORF type:complete len:103 (+),score=3.30 gb/GECG01013431.1/:1-309(+)
MFLSSRFEGESLDYYRNEFKPLCVCVHGIVVLVLSSVSSSSFSALNSYQRFTHMYRCSYCFHAPAVARSTYTRQIPRFRPGSCHGEISLRYYNSHESIECYS